MCSIVPSGLTVPISCGTESTSSRSSSLVATMRSSARARSSTSCRSVSLTVVSSAVRFVTSRSSASVAAPLVAGMSRLLQRNRRQVG